MSAWERWKAEHIDENGRHRTRMAWHVVGVWELSRSDGHFTCSKYDGPFCSWEQTVEESMRALDKLVPLGGDLPEGVTDYRGLWKLDREESAA